MADKILVVTGGSRGIGAATVFLLPERASYVTGAILGVPGGR